MHASGKRGSSQRAAGREDLGRGPGRLPGVVRGRLRERRPARLGCQRQEGDSVILYLSFDLQGKKEEVEPKRRLARRQPSHVQPGERGPGSRLRLGPCSRFSLCSGRTAERPRFRFWSITVTAWPRLTLATCERADA